MTELSNPLSPDPANEARNASIVQLSDYLPPEIIAKSLNAPTHEVKAIIAVHRRSGGLSPAEKELAEEVRTLASLAIKQATRMLLYGPTDQKMAIIRSVLTNASRLIGQDNEGGSEDYRVAFQELLGEMTQAPHIEQVVTDEGTINVEVDAASTPTDYQS